LKANQKRNLSILFINVFLGRSIVEIKTKIAYTTNQSLICPFPSFAKKSSHPPTNSSSINTMGMVFQLYLALRTFLFSAPSGVYESMYSKGRLFFLK
jgi:hypothetical protein